MIRLRNMGGIMSFCIQCGERLLPEGAFCYQCGTKRANPAPMEASASSSSLNTPEQRSLSPAGGRDPRGPGVSAIERTVRVWQRAFEDGLLDVIEPDIALGAYYAKLASDGTVELTDSGLERVAAAEKRLTELLEGSVE